VGVRWHTGATDELTITRPGPGRTPAAALDVIRRHGTAHTSTQIAEMLNAAGLTTGKGKPFTASGVARVRDAYKIFGPRTVAVRDGEVSVKQAAAELGIPADAVYNWLRNGQVPARRGPSGRSCLLWDPATPAIRWAVTVVVSRTGWSSSTSSTPWCMDQAMNVSPVAGVRTPRCGGGSRSGPGPVSPSRSTGWRWPPTTGSSACGWPTFPP